MPIIKNSSSTVFFIIGILCSQKISLGGEVFIGEILSFFIVLFNIKKLHFSKLLKTMLGLIIIWIFAQIISDISNETEIIKTIKGVGAPLFLITTLLACIIYFKDKKELIPSFFLGTTIGLWLYFLLNSPFYDFNPWKWGLGKAIGLSLLIYFSYWFKGKNTTILLCSILFLILSLSHSSRSLGGMLLISVMVYFILIKINNNKRWVKIKNKKATTFNIIAVLILLVIGLNSALSLLFTSELFLDNLPEEDALKYNIQASSDLGFLLGARSEIVISLEAFYDRPFFGHGSWAENYDYKYQYINLMDLLGTMNLDFKTALYLSTNDLIPCHSYLMGAIVWGGLFSGLFWLFILYKIINVMVKNSNKLSLLQVYLSITTLWNILFSPFGASSRWSTALALWVIFFTLNNKTKNKRS